MSKFTVSELTHIFHSYKGNFNNDEVINNVFTDSRVKTENGLFVPIKGENFDGHDYISQAIENGAVCAFWSKEIIDESIPDHFPLIIVDDTIEALQRLAAYYRKKVNPKVIGITGSNGKTTTKELIAQVLTTGYKVTKTEGNLNNHIGLPLTVLSMELDTEILVCEMGMSNFGEIERLSTIAQPDIAVITNIGESHIEFLGSREGIAQAKLEIIKGLNKEGILLIDGDEPLLQVDTGFETIRCGFDSSSDVRVYDVIQHPDLTKFFINHEQIEIPLLGEHQAKNASFAYKIGQLLDIPNEKIHQALKNFSFSLMRFQQIDLQNEIKIINDAYNASPTSMIASINVLKQMPFKKKIAVLGDILELGEYSISEHEKVGKHIDDEIDVIFTYGDLSENIINGLDAKYRGVKKHFTVKNELVNEIKELLTENTVVLFKASRGIKLEEVIEQLMSSLKGR